MDKKGYIIPEAAPFFLEGTNGICCLCIHGFSATPATYIPLSKLLQNAGFSVSVPLLPGHGTDPGDLLKCTHKDWFFEVEGKLLEAFERFEKVHVIGLSLGGALAARLAEKYSSHPRFGRLVLMVPALVLKRKIQYLLYPLMSRQRYRYWPPFKPHGDGYDTFRYVYPKMPEIASRSVIKNGLGALLSLRKIKVPTLLMQAEQDKSVAPVSTVIAYRFISSRKKEHIIYHKSVHNLLMGSERDAVTAKVLDFLTIDEV